MMTSPLRLLLPTWPRPRRPWGRRVLIALLVAVASGLAWALPFGPLFPWSPWKPGYQHLRLARADVYWAEGAALPAGLADVDRDIADSEAFHRFPVRSRVVVVLCRDWRDFDRFLPNYRGARSIGGATLVTGTAIYLTPRLAERRFDHREFLRHELSHATLNQHQSLWHAYRTSEAEPFFEGLAVSFGHQRAFATPAAVMAYGDAHDLATLLAPATPAARQRRDMRVNYQVWRYFLEYWVQARGRDAFQRLLLAAMEAPGEYVGLFEQVYGISLETAAADFTAALRTRRWVPEP